MSKEDNPNFKIPKSKIDFRKIFSTDPNFTPITQINDSKIRFIGKVCRFRGIIN